MTAWMIEALNPNLLQTIEGQPVLVHAGPFANIAIGQSSIIADLVGTKLSDFLVTESGFAADIGFEKFWNLKCRMSGLKPHAAVIVATVRALKMHGGGPAVRPGLPLAPEYKQENLGLLEKGCENLLAHIDIVKKSGVRPVVCVNKFYTDTDNELQLVKKIAQRHGAEAAVSDHWLRGGEGAIELAEKVAAVALEEHDFDYLYSLNMPLKQRIELIATEIYGAKSVSYSEKALEKIKKLDADPHTRSLGTCMVKTHLSLSHDPNLKGRPTGWELPIRDVMVYEGAGYVVPIAGDIKLMPGTGSDPAFRRIDVDLASGKVRGMF
jgi:formate--tetrahydrofolate ligase